TKGFLDLVKKIDSLSGMKKTDYSQIRSLYQAVSKGRDVFAMEKELDEFFGPPTKPAGKSLPFLLRFNPSIKYLDGIRKEQILFIKKVKAGFYYGALWPWKRDPLQITIHLGFCSHKMSDKDFKKLEELVKSKALHERVFEEFDSKIGGQIQGISLASFLQMAAMEKMSCSLKIQASNKHGYLYLLNGDLIEAETERLKGNKAAYQIIGWGNTIIEIEKPSDKTDNEINQPIIQILMEALKVKDEEKFYETEPAVVKDVKKERFDSDTEQDLAVSPELEIAVADDRGPPPKIPLIKRKDFKKITALAALAVIILGLGTLLTMRQLKARELKSDFQHALLAAENQPKLEAKINILKGFLNSHEPGKFTEAAEIKINEFRVLVQAQDLKNTEADAENLRKNEDYDNALAVYQKYLRKHPKGIHTPKIRQIILELSLLADDKDYEAFVKPDRSNISDSVLSYMQYLNKHPEGKHRNEVERLISDMADEYYAAFNKQVSACNSQQDWEKCARICETFLTIYPSHTNSPEIKKLQSFFQNKSEEKSLLEKLAYKAQSAGTDYNAAKQVYLDYLNSHPDSPLKNEILKQLAALKEQEKLAELNQEKNKIAALLLESKGKFVDNKDGTVSDTKTGLMWSMLDSSLEFRECLTYEEAVRYVKGLRTGGHKDWRLPNESELIGIYKHRPFFPSRPAQWYWTSKSYSRYSDGWQTMVTIVSTQSEDDGKKEQADARECGAVHAVRP
ncbi:MAG: DUF1566 domain-containing protein, partial [Proteobacteria bacterium]|nr:DUF1566 domain-containing protein [Pseudomonadota bacterium]